MNAVEYSAWMERAFLFVEGTLLQYAAWESPTDITEDIVRQALLEGLKKAKATHANIVGKEKDVPWNKALNITNPKSRFGKGSSKRHDIGMKEGEKLLLACELKWLKTENADDVMEALWRLALTHGVAAKERDCCRTFLIVGGLKKPFEKTLRKLNRHDVLLHWSPQGKAAQLPRPTCIKFGSLQRKKWGFGLLRSTLRRRKNYHRQPPPMWSEMRCSVLARSWKTIRRSEWKVALWELDFRAPCKKRQLNWNGLARRFLST